MWCLAYYNEVQHEQGYTTIEDVEPIQFFYMKSEAERAETYMYIMKSKLTNRKDFGILEKKQLQEMEEL